MRRSRKYSEKQSKKQSRKQTAKHTRINQSILGALEKRLLVWMAARMPAWVNPDLLTGLGFLGSLIIFAGYLLTTIDVRFMWLASFGFVLNWFGDSLDGTLARVRKIERPRYGYFIDHVIDTFAEVLIFVGVGLSPYVDLTLALLTLIGYLMVSNFVFIVTYVSGEFRISYAKLGPTEIRIIAILTNTVMLMVGFKKYTLPFGSFTFFDLVMMGLIGLFYIGFIVIVLLKGHQLSNEDTLAQQEKK